MAQYDIDLRDYWRILKKRKSIVILMVCLVGLSSYGFAKLKEPLPLYDATASVKIERATNMANLFMGVLWSEGDNMVTQAFIIKSFPVLMQTAKSIGTLPADVSEEEIRNSKTYLAVIQRLKAMVQAEQEQGTNIVNIRITSSDSQETAFIANAIAAAYQDYNIRERNRQTFETKAFIENQLELTSRRLREAEEDLRKFKENYTLIALDTQTANNLTKLSGIEASYDETRRERESLQSRLDALKIVPGSSLNIEGKFPPEPGDAQMHGYASKLSDLILKKKALLFDYTEKHPKVIEVNEQIQSLSEEIRKELNGRLAVFKKRESDLYETMIRLRKENLTIPDKALQLERLQREVKLQETLESELKKKYQEVLIQASGKVQEVVIVRPALVPTVPTNIPSKAMIIITGIFMGLVIGIVFTFVAETLDTSIGTIEDVENLLGVPVLGLIPILGTDEKNLRYAAREGPDRSISSRFLITHYDPKSLVAEAFRSLRTNLQFLGKERKEKSILMTSSFVQEGKTFNVVNIALSIAQAGEKVLLVEADLRKPTVHTTFGLSKEPGMTDYVLGNYDWKEVVNTMTDVMLGEFEIEDILRTPGLDNLHVITAGTTPLNPSEILRSSRFREFLKEAYQEYSFIFFDAPPIMPVADATEIAPLLDGVIMVYKVGKIGRGVLKRAKMSLDNVNAKVLGVVLNNVRPEVGPDYFKYQTQYYYEPAKPIDRDMGIWMKGAVRKVKKRFSFRRKYFRLMILIIAIALLLLGVFWKDILTDILNMTTGG
ncbi:MAG: polysaccharide biosynthesis tyrosine autokinase [Thermodesulfobacteriota bacterium]